ncbi:MAG: Ig-like domain-containing protein [Thermoanaerobaculia bacterium]
MEVHAQKKILFDAMHQQNAGEGGWTLDEDVCGKAQRLPTPDQTGFRDSTPEAVWSGALSAMGIDLVEKGFRVETLPIGSRVTWGDGTNEQDLSNYDVYIIPEPNVRFTPEEIAAIHKFVQNGGGLFMIADHPRANVRWSPEIFNELMGSPNVFGITFNTKSSDKELGWFDDHPDGNFTTDTTSPIIAAGVFGAPKRGLGLFEATSMTISGNAKGHAWRTTSTHDTATGVTFATSMFGAGRVAAIGDSSTAADTTSICKETTQAGYTDATFDNARVLANAVAWLAKEESSGHDTTKPTASITAPANISKDVTVTATASDNVGVTKVEFYVDAALKDAGTTSPYNWKWDSTSVANGSHTLMVKAYDAAANVGISQEVIVTVNNVGNHGRRWLWALVAALTLTLVGLILWRRILGRPVGVTLISGTPDETLSFILESVLPCRATVGWRADPATAVIASMRDRHRTTPLATSPITLNLPRGEHCLSVVFSMIVVPTEPIKVSVEIVAWPRFLRRRSNRLSVSRNIGVVSKGESPQSSGKGSHAEGQTTGIIEGAVALQKGTSEPQSFLQDDARVERAVIDVVNEVIRPDGVDRARLRALLRDRGVRATIATPFKVPESAHAVFRKYWFEPDDRAGAWLWVPVNGDSQFIVIPFDLRSFSRSSMLSYLASFYEGAIDEQESVAQAAVRFTSAARVIRGEEDSYRVVRRGALTGATLRTVEAAADDYPSDNLRLQRLEGRVESIQNALQSIEAGSPLPTSGGDAHGGEMRQLKKQFGDAFRSMEHRMDGVEQQLGQVRSSLDSLGRHIEATENSEKAAPPQNQGSKPHGDRDEMAGEQRATWPLRSEPEPWITESAPHAFEFAPAPIVRSEEVIALSALPAGWEERLSRARSAASFIESSAYARALQGAFEELRPLGSRDVAVVMVHLLPAVRGADIFYEVHFNEAVLDENGPIAFRCMDNPSARTPSQQFFIAFNERDERVSIVCPPGEYSPVSFDFAPLIQDVPAAPFTIEEVKQPARLERTAEGRYRVVARMSVSIA